MIDIPAGRAIGYYRRKAAAWLESAASFRLCVAAGGHPFGREAAMIMARSGVAMAAANRAMLPAPTP